MNIYLTINETKLCMVQRTENKKNKNHFEYNLIACFHHLEILLCRSMTEPCGKVMVLFSTSIAACCHHTEVLPSGMLLLALFFSFPLLHDHIQLYTLKISVFVFNPVSIFPRICYGGVMVSP